jgi:lipoate-protein ligase A
MMKAIDFPSLDPAELLAAEELLLDAAESALGGETLSFWESSRRFVVLGYGNRADTETDPEACSRRGIPVLRRISGGGTVLQGPGVLNYSLVLSVQRNDSLSTIHGANQFIMQRNAVALAGLLGDGRTGPDAGMKVEVQGHTDLTLGGRKFSGNAQRRRRNHLLFHGSILLQPDFDLMDAVLPMPSVQPAYRAGRSHRDFITRFDQPADAVKRALRRAWSATAAATLEDAIPDLQNGLRRLVCEKYGRPHWNLRAGRAILPAP